MADEIAAQFEVERFGKSMEMIDRIYAISGECRLTHLAVVAISQAVRNVPHA